MLLVLFPLLTVHCTAAQLSLPLLASPPLAPPSHHLSASCPVDRLSHISRQQVRVLLTTRVTPHLSLNHTHNCNCGGSNWALVGSVDATSSTFTCPQGWTRYDDPKSCGRNRTDLVASTIFSLGGRSFSEVCGRVLAYQKGHPDAFGASGIVSQGGLDEIYMDGVSLTHGPPSSRTHVWSFVAGAYSQGSIRAPTCPCSGPWTLIVPPFIGQHYTCESGNPGPFFSSSTLYQDDPLWDGEGCSSTSTCCDTPTYFCRSFSQDTGDDLEMRIMADEPSSGEDVRIFWVELYVR